MVRKVFGIRCGNMLVVQKKGEHLELRAVYIQEGQSRPFIQFAVNVLKNCEDTDEETILRTWDLICLATVINPGSTNLLSLDYLDCLLDPRRAEEFSWDEYLLELTMEEFLELSNTPYGVAPVNQQVEQPVDEVEVNPSASLNEWLVFPSSQDLEIPSHFKHLHEKHKVLFGANVDTTLKKLGVGFKEMQSQSMAALLIDVDAAIKEGDGPSVEFSTGVSPEDDQVMDNAEGSEDEGTATDNDAQDAGKEVGDDDAGATHNGEHVGASKEDEVHRCNIVLDVPQVAILVDSSTMGGAVGEQAKATEVSSEAAMPLIPSKDAQATDDLKEALTPQQLVPIVSDETKATEVLGEVAMHLVPSKDAQTIEDLNDALTLQQPITTDVVNMDTSTGIDTLEKKNKYKRAAKCVLTPPVLKKIKVSQDMVHKYDKFVTDGRKFKRKKKNEQPFDCGFYSILFMEYFNGKFIPKFDNEAIPDF
ncbi:hypothetical protein ACQ4PT_039226 [Festuca glaucescens]